MKRIRNRLLKFHRDLFLAIDEWSVEFELRHSRPTCFFLAIFAVSFVLSAIPGIFVVYLGIRWRGEYANFREFFEVWMDNQITLFFDGGGGIHFLQDLPGGIWDDDPYIPPRPKTSPAVNWLREGF
jgi:hypothetical protein